MDPEELDLTRESADVSIKVSGATPEATTPISQLPNNQNRRKSMYNFPFFLRHQDAVETTDETASPPVPKRGLKPSGTAQSLHPSMADDLKKRGSIIRRKRGSVKTKSLKRPDSDSAQSTDVSILVTEASPESPSPKPPLVRQQSEATVVQVLVHRESEEYNQDEEFENLKLRKVTSESELSNTNLKDFSNVLNDKHQDS